MAASMDSYIKIDHDDMADLMDTVVEMKETFSNLCKLTNRTTTNLFSQKPLDMGFLCWFCSFLAEQFEVQSDRADFLMGELMNAMKGGAQ